MRNIQLKPGQLVKINNQIDSRTCLCKYMIVLQTYWDESFECDVAFCEHLHSSVYQKMESQGINEVRFFGVYEASKLIPFNNIVFTQLI